MDGLAEQLREHALLEGDFVLRSGRRSSYYLDKYRFETRPELLRPLGERLAAAVAEFEPEADRLAGPALGAVALAASASLASGLPFVIVRAEAKSYGTGNRIEGPFEEGERLCLIEDVVTSGGGARGVRRGAAAGRAGRPERGLRGRPRGGRRGRAGPDRRPPAPALHGRRTAAGAKDRRKPAWLSRFPLSRSDAAVRVCQGFFTNPTTQEECK